MNNYLLQLLKEVKTLIIPGLGALTITNDATGEILFMPYLKYDDGTLAKHIAEKEKIDENDAKNMIAKFVRDVTTELDKGGTYDMYQFGSFAKVDGEVAFNNWNSTQTSTDTPPVAEKKAEPVIEEKPAPVVETPKVEEKPKVEAKEPVAEKQEEKPAPVVEAPKAEEKPKTEEKVTPDAKAGEKTPVSTPVVEKAAAKEPAKKTEKKLDKPAKPVQEKAPKEKKKRSDFTYIVWGILLVIIGFVGYVAWNFNSLKKDFPILAELAGENDMLAKGTEEMKNSSDTLTVEGSDSIPSESIAEEQEAAQEEVANTEETQQTTEEKPVKTPEKPKPVKKESTPAPPIDGSKSYHIIAGSFGSEANANRLAEKLRNDGFAEAAVSMAQGMYRVSIKGFSSMAEANTELQNVRSKVSNVWVMKM
jgi:flagellar basal body-associated protein FliL